MVVCFVGQAPRSGHPQLSNTAEFVRGAREWGGVAFISTAGGRDIIYAQRARSMSSVRLHLRINFTKCPRTFHNELCTLCVGPTTTGSGFIPMQRAFRPEITLDRSYCKLVLWATGEFAI